MINARTIGLKQSRRFAAEERYVPPPRPLDIELAKAVEAIKGGQYHSARGLLRQAAAEDIEAPEVYNLLGISYELEGDRVKAARFYRVAYYMDQTFCDASDNLARVCGVLYKGPSSCKWGLRTEEDDR